MNNQRIKQLNQISKHIHSVIYVMTKAFRIRDNFGLFYALKNYKSVHVLIFHKPEENERNNTFIKPYIFDLEKQLSSFVKVTVINNEEDIFQKLDAEIILDKAYLLQDKILEKRISNYATSQNLSCSSVESNVVVPVEVTSNKEEYSARTIRPKIWKNLYNFIDPVLSNHPLSLGEIDAENELQFFIENKLPFYEQKNHPELDYTSSLSVYLKYGLISPVRIFSILEYIDSSNKDTFIEELVIRRELAYNFVHYNPKYYNFEHMTYEWAYLTMKIHALDMKESIYTLKDYLSFNTHDPYFNAAMKEMVYLGKMHGYMRMYWCKKIIEWSPSFKKAYEIAMYLNNYYFYDGNTPNGFAGVAWCFGKHDRAWNERTIFGKLRYMNLNGLKRKFDIDKYVLRIEKEIMNHESI